MMGIVRFLFLLGIVFLVFRVVWHFLQPVSAEADKKNTGKSDNLLRCDRCDTLIPLGLAVQHEGNSYCSPSCRDDTTSK